MLRCRTIGLSILLVHLCILGLPILFWPQREYAAQLGRITRQTSALLQLVSFLSVVVLFFCMVFVHSELVGQHTRQGKQMQFSAAWQFNQPPPPQRCPFPPLVLAPEPPSALPLPPSALAPKPLSPPLLPLLPLPPMALRTKTLYHHVLMRVGKARGAVWCDAGQWP